MRRLSFLVCATLVFGSWTVLLSGDVIAPTNPVPNITSIGYPSSIVLGQSATIDVYGRNDGDQANEGYMQISFPSNPGPGDLTLVSDDFDPGWAGPHWAGETVFGCYGTCTVTLSYSMVEGGDIPWPSSTTHHLRVQVTPSTTGTFNFYVKLNLMNDVGDFSHDPPSGTMDQQFEYVHVRSFSVVPPTSNPIPVITSVNYPSSITLGQSATIDLYGRNDGDQADEGYLQISFPSNPGAGDLSLVNHDFGPGWAGPHWAGETVNGCYGTCTVTLSYSMVEGADIPWPSGMTHYLRVSVTPSTTGTFTFYAKLNLMGNTGNFNHDPSSGTMDQQSEYVRVYTFDVVPSTTNPIPVITNVDYPSSITLGETATMDVYGRNDGDQADEGYLQISFPSNPGPSDLSLASNDFDAGWAGPHWAGETVNGCYGTCTVTLSYSMVEGADIPWASGVTHYLSVQVTPSTSGLFIFYAKLNLMDNTGNFNHDPPSGTVDQQSEYVKVYTFNVMPSTTNPIPVISSVNYPSSIVLGDYATIDVYGRNDGDQADEGYLQISFPSNPGPGELPLINDDFDIGWAGPHWAGEVVNGCYGTCTVTLSYSLVEGGDIPWPSGMTHYLSVQVTPSVSGLFTFYVKLNLRDNSDDFAHDPASGIQDQQSEYIYVHTISVIPPATHPVPIITNVNYPSSITLGQTATIDVYGRNDGDQADEGYLQISFPSNPGPGELSLVSDTFGPGLASPHWAGEVVNGCYGNCTVMLSYSMVEGADNPWPSGVTNHLQIEVMPPTTGTFIFYVKLILRNNTGGWHSDPLSGIADQQSEFVRVFTIYQSELSVFAGATPVNGIAPLLVQFSVDVTGGTSPYSYSWDFGDGRTGVGQSPSHVYTPSSDAAYQATCTVLDSGGISQTSNAVAIFVDVPESLTIIVTATPTSGIAPLLVNFSVNVTGGTPPYSYSWDFGDGTVGFLQSPSHLYEPSSSAIFLAKALVLDSQLSEAQGSSPAIIVTVPFSEDLDNDGLPDEWENSTFRNLNQGPNDDYDLDGLKNLDEFQLNTNPKKKDTDGDGIWDGVEVHQKRFDTSLTNPTEIDLDLDDDGKSDADPLRKDIFVEVDWMNDYWKRVSWNSLYATFERHFIFIHFIKSDVLPSVSHPDRQARIQMYQDNFTQENKGVYHYAILGYGADLGSIPSPLDRSGASSNIPGDTLFVSVGLLNDRGSGSQAITSTFLHELGHNMGLHHNGNTGNPNDSSVYVSVMSYYYQLEPTRWPSGWNGVPNFGSKPGWDDWSHLNLLIDQNGDNPLLGEDVVDAVVEPIVTISHVSFKGRMPDGSYAVEASVSAPRPGFQILETILVYRIQDEDAWLNTPMTDDTGGNVLVGYVDIEGGGILVNYYICVKITEGHEVVNPANAPSDYLTFTTEQGPPTTEGQTDLLLVLIVATIIAILVILALIFIVRTVRDM